jgi:hypothetical protein
VRYSLDKDAGFHAGFAGYERPAVFTIDLYREGYTMRRVFVRLTPPARDALLQIALKERRHPSDQAAIILERELIKQTATPTKEVSVT